MFTISQTATTLAHGTDIVIDTRTHVPADARVRATLVGHGGSGVSGYGADEASARDDLAATIDFNLAHNGRVIA